MSGANGSDAEPVVPVYGRSTLADLLPSAVAAVGVTEWPNPLALPAAESYVVLLVDGLGWNLLQRHADAAPYLAGLAERARPITAGVPSTTATSLTSLGTGLAPGAHGVVGFTTRIPGTTRLLDALKWDPKKVEPATWQVHDTVFAQAAQAGVATSVVTERAFRTSGLTGASQRGAHFVGGDSPGERILAAEGAAAQPGSLTYVYDAALDATGHRRGCTSPAWRYQLSLVDTFARMLREVLPATAALVITGDHGMVDVDPASRLDVDADEHDDAGLLEGVEVFGGEARFRHLYCAAGATDEVARRWGERVGDAALVRTRGEAVDEGWFGPVEEQVWDRLGDVVVASMGDTAVMAGRKFPREAKLVGLHGSLTPDEMLVPLLLDAPG